MWWSYWWWHHLMAVPDDKPCDKSCHRAHDDVEQASDALEQSFQDVKASTREDRHGARNVRMLMQALAARLEKRNAAHS